MLTPCPVDKSYISLVDKVDTQFLFDIFAKRSKKRLTKQSLLKFMAQIL